MRLSRFYLLPDLMPVHFVREDDNYPAKGVKRNTFRFGNPMNWSNLSGIKVSSVSAWKGKWEDSR